MTDPSAKLAPAALLWLAACSSTAKLEPDQLPFHVAIAPIFQPEVGQATPGEHPGKETELRLSMDGQPVTKAVTEALQEYCFTRVTLLETPEQDDDAPVDAFTRAQRFVEEARKSGADLVLEFGLRYEPELYREGSDTFWLNFPLFLFAWPSLWWLNDNVYHADVELTATVYDLEALAAGQLALGDPAARVTSTTADFASAGLNFTQRAPGVGAYALGLVCPSGYLSRQSEDVTEEMLEKIIEILRVGVVQGIQSRRGDLMRADDIGPVYIEPAEVELTREGEELVVRGSVHLRRDSLARRVHAIQLNAGESRVTAKVAADQPMTDTGDYLVQPFEGRLPFAADERYLRVVCEAGARDRYVRTWTFLVP